MNSFRFLHAADLHLDSPFRGMMYLPAVIHEKIKESTFFALERLIALAIEEKVDFVVFSGDVYDLADRSLRAQFRFQRAMERLAEHAISAYIIHGNHDPEDGRRASLDWPGTVHFFSSDHVETVPVINRQGREVAHVHGVSYATSAVTENLAVKFRVQNPRIYNIGLLHTNVDGDAAHDNYAPCSMPDLIQAGMNYWALGHIHKRQVLCEQPLIVYPGNIQGRSIKETGAKGCYIVDVSDTGKASLSFHETDALRWADETLSIQGIETVQQLKEAIEERLERIRSESGGRGSVIRLHFVGRGPMHAVLRHDAQLQELMEPVLEKEADRLQMNETYPFVWVESCKVQSGPDMDMEQLLEQKSFIGDLLRISRTLAENDEQMREFVGQALSPLTSHAKIVKYLAAASREEQQEWLNAAEQMAVDYLLAQEEEEG